MQVLDDLDAWSALLFSYDGCNGFLIKELFFCFLEKQNSAYTVQQ